MTDESLQVLIVDDHPVFREGLAGILADANQLTVVGQAAEVRKRFGSPPSCSRTSF